MQNRTRATPVSLYGQPPFANVLPVIIAGAVLLMVETVLVVLLVWQVRRR